MYKITNGQYVSTYGAKSFNLIVARIYITWLLDRCRILPAQARCIVFIVLQIQAKKFEFKVIENIYCSNIKSTLFSDKRRVNFAFIKNTKDLIFNFLIIDILFLVKYFR